MTVADLLQTGGLGAFTAVVYFELRSTRMLLQRVLLSVFPRARNGSNDPEGLNRKLPGGEEPSAR